MDDNKFKLMRFMLLERTICDLYMLAHDYNDDGFL